jgi:hypothetical protein
MRLPEFLADPGVARDEPFATQFLIRQLHDSGRRTSLDWTKKIAKEVKAAPGGVSITVTRLRFGTTDASFFCLLVSCKLLKHGSNLFTLKALQGKNL